MGVFRVPPGARSRPHYHANCESAVYILSGPLEVRWGDRLEQVVRLEPRDLVYVPPRETHVLENLSDSEPAEYVVARDAPQEDSVEVPWAQVQTDAPLLLHVEEAPGEVVAGGRDEVGDDLGHLLVARDGAGEPRGRCDRVPRPLDRADAREVLQPRPQRDRVLAGVRARPDEDDLAAARDERRVGGGAHRAPRRVERAPQRLGAAGAEQRGRVDHERGAGRHRGGGRVLVEEVGLEHADRGAEALARRREAGRRSGQHRGALEQAVPQDLLHASGRYYGG